MKSERVLNELSMKFNEFSKKVQFAVRVLCWDTWALNAPICPYRPACLLFCVISGHRHGCAKPWLRTWRGLCSLV